jgi:hypothetical protein
MFQRFSWIAVVVVLFACKKQPNQPSVGMKPNTNWKGTLADLLPSIGDIESITVTSEGAKVGDPLVTRDLQDSERRFLVESFANTRAVSLEMTFQITGYATIVSRKGKTFRIRLYSIDSTDLVYWIEPPQNEPATPHFVQLDNSARVLGLLPNSKLRKSQ